MARRKRLTPAQADYLDVVPADLETKSIGFPARAPIAQVAGEAASAAALDELAGEMRRAREDGRMIQAMPLGEIDNGYLTRDRIAADTAELDDLVASIRERGQQTPVEVVALDAGGYGLISGWRRVTALRRLHDETGEDRFASVLAILRRPATASDAYVAMVEENEIRLGLSFYERARIVAKAVEQGVYLSEKEALNQLFSTASRPKRSKIKSFLALYHAADDLLRHPSAINERLGVALSREVADNPTNSAFLREALAEAAPDTVESEVALLQEVLTCMTQKKTLGSKSGMKSGPNSETGRATAPDLPAPKGEPDEDNGAFTLVHGVDVDFNGDRITLRGRGVTKAFRERLFAWIIAEQERISDEIAADPRR